MFSVPKSPNILLRAMLWENVKFHYSFSLFGVSKCAKKVYVGCKSRTPPIFSSALYAGACDPSKDAVSPDPRNRRERDTADSYILVSHTPNKFTGYSKP
jgi:hypothetical protein